MQAANGMTGEDDETSQVITVSDASNSNTHDADGDESNEAGNLESVSIEVAAHETCDFDDVVDAIYTDADDIENHFVSSTSTLEDVAPVYAESSGNGIIESPISQPVAVAVIESLKTPEEPEISTQEETGDVSVEEIIQAAASESAESVGSGEDLKNPERENTSQITDDVVDGFNAADFYGKFPHITLVHPVHIFARYLLEYFGFGLKLSQIARLVERSGYKHSSRNFTDSIHSALKNKRKTTGEFYFNAVDRVWELSHWKDAKGETAKRADKPVKSEGGQKFSSVSQCKPKEVSMKDANSQTAKSVKSPAVKSNVGIISVRAVKKNG